MSDDFFQRKISSCRQCIMHNSTSWDISYSSKFSVLMESPETIKMFLPLSREVATTDPFLALNISFRFARASWKWMVEGRAIEEEYSARCERNLDVSGLLSAHGISWF